MAAKLEQLRYRFYVVEQALSLTYHPANRFANVRLYVLISQSHCQGRPWQQVTRDAIAGGADCLQLREKYLDSGEFYQRAKEFVALCREQHVISIINDRADISVAVDADGVHVGQGDLPAREARRLIGQEKILGVSTHSLGHARQALLDSADYIGVGPIFPSQTKVRDFLAGLDYARQVAQEIPLPAVAISGITAQNLTQVLNTGIKAIAVTAAVTQQPDVRLAAQSLKSAISQHQQR